MNPSAHSSVYTATDARSYTSKVFRSGSTQSYYPFVDHAPSLYENHSSSAPDWSCVFFGHSDTEEALFEAFLTAEVPSTSSSSSCTSISTQPLPSYDPETRFLHHTTEAAQFPAQLFDGCQYASTAFQSTIPSTFEFVPHEARASLVPLDLTYPPPHNADMLEGCCPAALMSRCSRSNHRAEHCNPLSYLCPSPSPELSVPAPTGNSSISFASEPWYPETTMPSISPDLIYPSALRISDLEDDHSAGVTSQSSLAGRRAAHRSPSSSPYPTPSPEPSPRTSSVIIASQRRNTPASTTAPASNAWQCPHCPYVQRNRRSPDLKRHIKTHTRGVDVADWVCCGLPVLNAIELGVPERILKEAQVFEFDGVLMVGGCRKAFSRRDALTRHLQRERGKCFGDALSMYQRGNKETC